MFSFLPGDCKMEELHGRRKQVWKNGKEYLSILNLRENLFFSQAEVKAIVFFIGIKIKNVLFFLSIIILWNGKGIVNNNIYFCSI